MKCLTVFHGEFAVAWWGNGKKREKKLIHWWSPIALSNNTTHCRGCRLHSRFYAASSHDTMQKFYGAKIPMKPELSGTSRQKRYMHCQILNRQTINITGPL